MWRSILGSARKLSGVKFTSAGYVGYSRGCPPHGVKSTSMAVDIKDLLSDASKRA